MKTTQHTLVYLLGLGTALWVSGVAAQEQKQTAEPKEAAVASMAEIKHQIGELQNRIGLAVSALENVKQTAKKENPEGLKAARIYFSERMQALDSQYELVRRQGVVARAKAEEHYQAWMKELAPVRDTGIREKAQDRLSDSREQFEKILAMAEEVNNEFVPLLGSLKDIDTFLEVDCSAKAVKKLSNTIWKTGYKAEGVNGSLSHLCEHIDRTIKAL